MPKVPTYQRRVETAPLPSARLSADRQPVPTAAPLPDLTGVQRVVAQQYQEEVDRADRLAILDADNQLDTRQREVEAQARARRGKDALGATQSALEAYDMAAGEVAGTLATPRQREQFEARRLARRQALAQGIEHHADREHRRYQDETYSAAIGARLEAAAQATDPTMRAWAIAEGESLIRQYGQDNGWDAAVTAGKAKEFASRAHLGALDAMLAVDNDLAASAYFQQHRGALTADAAAKVTRALEETSSKTAAQRQADAIIAGGGTYAEWKTAAAAIEAPKVRELVEDRLRRERADRELAERDAREARVLTATNLVERHGSFGAIPGAVLAELSVGERASLRAYARQLTSGGGVETDLPTYYTLRTMAAQRTTRAQFLRENLLTYRDRLDDGDLKQLIDMQSSLRAGAERADDQARKDARKAVEELDGWMTHQQVVVGLYREALGTARNGAQDVKDLSAFQRQADRAVGDWALREQRKPTNAELREIVGGLLVEKITDDGWVWDTKKRVFQLTIADVPAADRAAIEKELRDRGRAVTDEQILRLYQRANMPMGTP